MKKRADAVGVKDTKVWLTKAPNARVEDNAMIDSEMRQKIAELRAANDALASSNTSFSRHILRVGDKLSKIRKKIEEGSRREPVEAIITRAKELLSPVPGVLFACQLRNCGRPAGTRRFTEEDLLLSYAIYKQSSRCYLFLSKVRFFESLF
jgi:hypothetical protein